MLSETQDKLRQWGAWLRGGSVGLGYGVNALATVRGGGLPLPPICDDVALAIDRVIAEMKKYNYVQYRCIKLAYAEQKSNRAIGREIEIPARTVQLRIEQAEQWLDLQFANRSAFQK